MHNVSLSEHRLFDLSVFAVFVSRPELVMLSMESKIIGSSFPFVPRVKIAIVSQLVSQIDRMQDLDLVFCMDVTFGMLHPSYVMTPVC